MKYIYILLFCIIGIYVIFKYNEIYSTFENFDSSLVPVSSIITLAKITEKLIDHDGNLIFPANFKINKNLTVTGTATIEDDIVISGNNIVTGQLNTSGYEKINGTLNTPLIIGGGTSDKLDIDGTVTVNNNLTVNNSINGIRIKGNANIADMTVTDNVTIDGKLNTYNIYVDNPTGTVTANYLPNTTTGGNLTAKNGWLDSVTANSIIANEWNSPLATFPYANDVPFLDKIGVKRELYQSNGPTYFGAGTGSTGGWSFESNNTKLLTIDKDGNAVNFNALVVGNSPTSSINVNTLNIKSGTSTPLSITSPTSPSSTTSTTAEIGCDNLEFKTANAGSGCTVTIKGSLSAKSLTPLPKTSNIVPPGTIMLFSNSSSIPMSSTDWLLCDGRAIPSTSSIYNKFPDNKTPNIMRAGMLYGGSGNNCGYTAGVVLTGSTGGTCQGGDEHIPIFSEFLVYIKI